MILPCSGKQIISNHYPNSKMAKQVYYFKVMENLSKCENGKRERLKVCFQRDKLDVKGNKRDSLQPWDKAEEIH